MAQRTAPAASDQDRLLADIDRLADRVDNLIASIEAKR